MASAVLKKRALIGVCVVSAIAMVAEILFARGTVKDPGLSIWRLELLLLPWVFFIGSYLSIVFTSWFEQESAPLARKALSTLGAAGITGLVTLIYFGSMFH
jgi:hypothetical protein